MDLKKQNLNTFSFKIGENQDTDSLNITLQKLQESLNKVTLDYRIYDIYNIQSQITSASDFDIKINSLVNNSATVINCPTAIIKNFNGQQTSFTRGDIVYKNNSGDMNVIKSEVGGWYRPKINENDPSKITFEFSNNNDEDVEIKQNVMDSSTIYGIMNTLGPDEQNNNDFNKVFFVDEKGIKNYVEPMLKTYVKRAARNNSEKDGWEEIVFDPSVIKITNSTTNTSKLSLQYNTHNVKFDGILYIIK